MNKTSNFTITLLALAGAAFSQDVNRILARDVDESAPRGSILRPNNPGGLPADTQKQLSNELRAKNQINFYKRGQLIYQRDYQACMVKENKKPDANPYNCQHKKDIADYYAGMAAGVQQPQVTTARSSQAMRDLLKQRDISAPAPPPSQVGQPLPKMPSYANGRRP